MWTKSSRWLNVHFGPMVCRPLALRLLAGSSIARRRLLIALLAIALIALAGCSAGMALGTGATCTISTALLTQVTGDCSRTFDELAETANEGIAVSTADIAPFTSVDWEMTVESGRVAVTFTDFRGNAQTTEVTPASPGSGSMRIQLDPINRINFTLEPLGGPAEGVEYQLKFVCDCMP